MLNTEKKTLAFIFEELMSIILLIPITSYLRVIHVQMCLHLMNELIDECIKRK